MAGPVEVRVSHVANDKGKIFVAVCDQAHFLKKCTLGASAPAQTGDTVVPVPAVPAGAWAVLAFHDENENAELDRNLIGIPKEDYGFSRDAASKFGPPKFEQALIQIGDEPLVVPIRLH
ncbi:MAG: DUF2141 domain-containing protein [Pseudomonadota bacterium]